MRAVEEYATERLKAGHKIAGFYLKPKRGRRVWANTDKVRDIAMREFNISLEEKVLLSPAKAEKLLASMKVDKETIKDFINANASTVSDGETLARHDSEDYDFFDADTLEEFN